nr:Chain A, TAR DNA-binding protein 43 [Homo sapiens]
NFGEFS